MNPIAEATRRCGPYRLRGGGDSLMGRNCGATNWCIAIEISCIASLAVENGKVNCHRFRPGLDLVDGIGIPNPRDRR